MNSTISRWLLLAVLVVLSIAATLVFTLSKHFADLHVYYSASLALFFENRVDLYSADFADDAIMDYRYPPFFLFLFGPFVFLPYEAVEFVWLWVCILAFAVMVTAARRGFETVTPVRAGTRAVILISLFASAKFFVAAADHFNVHIIFFTLVVVSFYLLLKQRQILAGILMALAITIKVSPILLLPYFALKKQWRFLAMTVAMIFAFNLLPAFYFGWNLNLDLLRQWHDHVIVNDRFHEINGPLDLSLRGQLKRYLTEIDYTKRVSDIEYQNVNFLSLSENEFRIVWPAAGLIFFGSLLLIWYLARERRMDHNGQFDSMAFYEFGIMLCLMLLVAPRTNGYYLIALFVALLPFVNSLLMRKSKIGMTLFALILLGACFLPLVPGRYAQRFLLVAGVEFWVIILVWAALIYGLLKENTGSVDLVEAD